MKHPVEWETKILGLEEMPEFTEADDASRDTTAKRVWKPPEHPPSLLGNGITKAFPRVGLSPEQFPKPSSA